MTEKYAGNSKNDSSMAHLKFIYWGKIKRERERGALTKREGTHTK
jgi:hypothetical protein